MDKIILAVSTGRSGTMSLAMMLRDVFLANRHGGGVYHEQDGPALYNLFAEWKEKGDGSARERARELIAAWEPGCAIVGNGYQPWLELIRDVHGERVGLIHLRRGRAGCVASLLRHFRQGQTGALAEAYYADWPEVADPLALRRMAAFHFGECMPDAWLRLPLLERVGWYYDRSHALIAASEPLFGGCLQLRTEELSADETMARLTAFVEPGWALPPQGGRHANFDWLAYERLDFLSPAEINQLRNFYANFDPIGAARNPYEGDFYFWTKVKAMIRQLALPEQRAEARRRYREVLMQRLAVLEQLDGLD